MMNGVVSTQIKWIKLEIAIKVVTFKLGRVGYVHQPCDAINQTSNTSHILIRSIWLAKCLLPTSAMQTNIEIPTLNGILIWFSSRQIIISNKSGDEKSGSDHQSFGLRGEEREGANASCLDRFMSKLTYNVGKYLTLEVLM